MLCRRKARLQAILVETGAVGFALFMGLLAVWTHAAWRLASDQSRQSYERAHGLFALAVIMNYLKRADVRGTWLESHFRWQIRTFWFALLWVVIALLLAATFIGIPLAIAIAWVAGLWVLYRIVRGWLRLMNREPMPAPG